MWTPPPSPSVLKLAINSLYGKFRRSTDMTQYNRLSELFAAQAEKLQEDAEELSHMEPVAAYIRGQASGLGAAALLLASFAEEEQKPEEITVPSGTYVADRLHLKNEIDSMHGNGLNFIGCVRFARVAYGMSLIEARDFVRDECHISGIGG